MPADDLTKKIDKAAKAVLRLWKKDPNVVPLLVGPPGLGKSMVAQKIMASVANLGRTDTEAVDAIYELARLIDPADPPRGPRKVPFRAPHYTVSNVGMIGSARVSEGVVRVTPGELSLAHLGVLCLDEATEFMRPVLQAIGTAHRNEAVTIPLQGLPRSRVTLPANFALLMIADDEAPIGRLDYMGLGDLLVTVPVR